MELSPASVRTAQERRGLAPGDERHVTRHLLPGGAAGQEFEEDGEVGQSGDELLPAHHSHMDGRKQCGQARVTFVLDQDDGTGLGDGEVRARDPHAGPQEVLAQILPDQPRKPLCILRRIGDAHLLRKQPNDLCLALVDGRNHEMTGTLPSQLDDPLAQVGLHHGHPGALQSGAKVDLFGGHRFRLDDQVDGPLPREIADVGAGRLGVLCTHDDRSGGARPALERCEQFLVPVERLVLDGLRPFA